MCIKKEIALRIAQLEFTAARLKKAYAAKRLEREFAAVCEDSKAIIEKWDSIKASPDSEELSSFFEEVQNELLLTQKEFELVNSALGSPVGLS